MRKQVGDTIYVTEGKGSLYKAEIISSTKNETQLKILEAFGGYGEHGYQVRLAVSPLRLKDRFEWMMEKAVELGVNEIIPLQCKRTDPYKARFKASRIETILMTALKQSKRTRLPQLHEIKPFESWVKQEGEGLKLMGWCEADTSIQHYSAEIKNNQEVTLLIGPEGDFTDEEVSLAKEAGFQAISLGENRLRTETAAIFGLGILKYELGF